MSDKDKRILLVEDDAIIALSEEKILQRSGYRVMTVHTAQDAIEKVREAEIDLILMDIDLGPGKMNGTDAAEIILEEKEIPIVFLTNHAEKEMVDKVKGITRYGYILKNSGRFVLLESIAMAFELYNSYLEIRERERRYDDLIRNLDDIIYNLDVETGEFGYISPVFTRILGYTKEELLNLTVDDIDPNYPSKKFIEFWNNKPEGSSQLFETFHKTKDGTHLRMQVNGIFLIHDGEKYLFGVSRMLK